MALKAGSVDTPTHTYALAAVTTHTSARPADLLSSSSWLRRLDVLELAQAATSQSSAMNCGCSTATRTTCQLAQWNVARSTQELLARLDVLMPTPLHEPARGSALQHTHTHIAWRCETFSTGRRDDYARLESLTVIIALSAPLPLTSLRLRVRAWATLT